jgi:subtilisin family serine protease
MHLDKAHQIARGDKVLVAVIDSKIDAAHPELRGAIAKQIDVLDERDFTPHAHGTAMAGAIVAKSQLTGVAPAAQIVAIRAFASRSSSKASGTSFQLTRAIDAAVEAGARVINLSFAGPADPMLSRAMKLARERGVVLVAAMGNAGPKSGPLYPAADPNVIAVTATDAEDRRYTDATPGGYVAVAAPGVDVLVPAPNEEYGLSTGTSVATAHVSGVVALLLSRRPSLTPEAIRGLLTAAARKPAEPDPALGAGIADAYGAVVATENGTSAQPGAALQETRPALTMQ